MPKLSQYFVKSSFLAFALGFTIAGLVLAAKGGVVSSLVWRWRAAHIVLLVNGWFLQLSMGVAYWIFPRIRNTNRGRTRFAWAAFLLFQAGLLLAVASLLVLWWSPAGDLLAYAVLVQVVAVALYAVHLWPRVRQPFVRSKQR